MYKKEHMDLSTLENPFFPMGKSTIMVQNDDFEDGYYEGLLVLGAINTPLTDESLYEFLWNNIKAPHVSRRWKAGYLLGAAQGLHLGKIESMLQMVSWVTVAPHRRLLLNREHFAKGFEVGRRDYQAEQPDGIAPMAVTLTARELLDYVAMRDPHSRLYLPHPQMRSALEFHIGRFVGYLCMALFPQHELHEQSSTRDTERDTDEHDVIYVRQSTVPVACPVIAEEA